MKLCLIFGLVLASACLCACSEAPPLPVHIVYVQFFDQDVRVDDDNVLNIVAPTLHSEVTVLTEVYKAPHDVLAVLLAACTKHTKILTETEDGFEVETFIFVYSAEDAAKLRQYRIAVPPPQPGDEPPRRQKKATNERRKKIAMPPTDTAGGLGGIGTDGKPVWDDEL